MNEFTEEELDEYIKEHTIPMGPKNKKKLVFEDEMDSKPIVIFELTQGQFAIVDKADWDFIKQYSWSLHKSGGITKNNWYPASGMGGRKTCLHKFLVNYPITDHINGNGLDNRRCNLRAATNSQNQRNRRGRGASHYKGVYKEGNRWRARIRLPTEYKHLGLFDTEYDAALAYDKCAKKHFGDYAWLNVL